MRPAEIIEFLTAIEAAWPVDAWKVRGIRIWPIVRVHLGLQLRHRGRPSSGRAGSLLEQVREVADVRRSVVANLRDPTHRGRLEAPADLLLLARTTSRQPLLGSYHDVHMDPIVDALEDANGIAAIMEMCPYPSSYRLPRSRPTVLVRPAMVMARMRARLRRLQHLETGGIGLQGYAAFRDHLAATGVPAEAPDEHNLAVQVGVILEMARYFEATMLATRPRAALSVCYFDLVGMAFTLAARRAGVRSVDLQHGTIHTHPAYDRLSPPSDGYGLVPERFWCWSPADAQVLAHTNECSGGAHRAVVGGQPWACRWALPRGAMASVREQVKRLRACSGAGVVVLLSLQWDRGLTDELRAILRASPETMTWWIRLHPLMGSERATIRAWVHGAIGQRGHVDEPTDLPLPLLLRSADVHCTRWSSVVGEAAAYGVRSVIIDERGIDLAEREIASGWARHVDPRVPEAVVRALAEQASSPRAAPQDAALGSMATLKSALATLLEPR